MLELTQRQLSPLQRVFRKLKILTGLAKSAVTLGKVAIKIGNAVEDHDWVISIVKDLDLDAREPKVSILELPLGVGLEASTCDSKKLERAQRVDSSFVPRRLLFNLMDHRSTADHKRGLVHPYGTRPAS